MRSFASLRMTCSIPLVPVPTLIVISLIVVSLTVMIVVSQIAGPIEVREVSEDAVVLVVRPCGEEEAAGRLAGILSERSRRGPERESPQPGDRDGMAGAVRELPPEITVASEDIDPPVAEITHEDCVLQSAESLPEIGRAHV